jgi:hypothetical protein
VTENFGKVRCLVVVMFWDLMGQVIITFNLCVPSGTKAKGFCGEGIG